MSGSTGAGHRIGFLMNLIGGHVPSRVALRSGPGQRFGKKRFVFGSCLVEGGFKKIKLGL